MKTYTVTFSEGEFWQVQQAIEERAALLERRRDTIAAAGLPTADTSACIFDAAKALRRMRSAPANSPALSAMLTEGR